MSDESIYFDFATTARDYADGYRRLGFSVVPCWMPQEGQAQWKRPKLSEWAKWHDEPIAQVVHDQWFNVATGEHRERTNIGALTGKGAGNLLVIDLDTHKTPEAARWWEELLELDNNGIPLETVESITGGGGRQLFFWWPKDVRGPTNRTPIGVDIRGQGGFVVLPPSNHNSGRQYAWAPGGAPWERAILPAPDWLVDAVEALVGDHGGDQSWTGPKQRTASPEADFTPFGSRQDGREVEMYRAVWRAVLELYRRAPILPGPKESQEASEAAYLAYESRVRTRIPGIDNREGLEREGRGQTVWARKWAREMRRWGSPKMAAAAARPDPTESGQNQYDPNDFQSKQEEAQQQAKADPSKNPFKLLSVEEILAMEPPRWLIDGLVIEGAMGVLYSLPGALKTFIALDLSLSIATGQTEWWGHPISYQGAVLYISSEGAGGMQYRLRAWAQHRGVDISRAPLYLIKDSLSFMDGANIGYLVEAIEAKLTEIKQSAALIVIDTISRVLPGADENLQKEMTVFVRSCDQVRQKFSTTVLGIHHTNKAGTLRGSSVIPGACDFLIQVKREPGAMTGSIFVEKMKDAEDGQSYAFDVKKIELPPAPGKITGASSLVVDGTATPTPTAAGSTLDEKGWPPQSTCDAIIEAMTLEFFAKNPLGSERSERPAWRWIAARWNLKHATAKDMVKAWVSSGVIVIDEIRTPGKSRVRGYRKA